MNKTTITPPLTMLDQIYRLIPDAAKNAILASKKKAMNRLGTHVRTQPSIPKETYVMLEYFGAFSGSESSFFTSQAHRFIETRAVEIGIMNTIMGGK